MYNKDENGVEFMELKINRNSGVPLYKQVKTLITEKIRSGELYTGFRMPTERELSESLGLSRNTVSTAYKDLEKEGLLISHQGKGTFVAEESGISLSNDLKERIVRFVDMGLEEAIETGLEPKDFLKLVEDRVGEKVKMMRSSKAVYVECNTEQASFFANQLSLGTNMECVPLTISDLIEMNDETKLILYNARVIVSTFNHVPEVIEYTREFGKDVLGVAINPDLATIVKIARLPKDTRYAFVCISEEFSGKVRDSLTAAGLSDLDMEFTHTQDREELKDVIRDKDMILVSPGRFSDCAELADENKILRLDYNLDDGSLKTLQSKLLELNIV